MSGLPPGVDLDDYDGVDEELESVEAAQARAIAATILHLMGTDKIKDDASVDVNDCFALPVDNNVGDVAFRLADAAHNNRETIK